MCGHINEGNSHTVNSADCVSLGKWWACDGSAQTQEERWLSWGETGNRNCRLEQTSCVCDATATSHLTRKWTPLCSHHMTFMPQLCVYGIIICFFGTTEQIKPQLILINRLGRHRFSLLKDSYKVLCWKS